MGKIEMSGSTVAGLGCNRLEFKDIGVVLDVTTEVGPRIISLTGPGAEENILFVDNENRGRGDWKLIGGHRVWVYRSPLADETEESYASDNQKCITRVASNDTVFEFKGGVDPVSKIRRGLKISQNSNGGIDVVNVVENCSDMLWSGGVWGLTCINPNQKGMASFAIPLGTGTDWDIVPMVFFRKWADHTSKVNDPQFVIREDQELMTIWPQGREAKRMFAVYQGWMGCRVAAGYSFFKIAKYEHTLAHYYPHHCNMALYIGPESFMVEMETFGPSTVLPPGERCEHKETWVFTDPIGWRDLGKIKEVLAPHIAAYWS